MLKPCLSYVSYEQWSSVSSFSFGSSYLAVEVAEEDGNEEPLKPVDEILDVVVIPENLEAYLRRRLVQSYHEMDPEQRDEHDRRLDSLPERFSPSIEIDNQCSRLKSTTHMHRNNDIW